MNLLELAQAGAILSQGDSKLDSVSARQYQHPALGERPVVRLVGDTLGAAEDLTLEFHGFHLAKAEKVGYQLRKGLGFPGWALVNDPEHAAFALEVVKQFRAQAKLARSRPGAAKEGFDEIAGRLGRSVPHFLPSFYEEAGRVFLEHGNATMATTMFGKARQAERVHALKVDESLRRESFLEFALAGAVSIKTLTEYSKELSSEHNPEEAYHHFRELCLRRTLGGMPPWSSMLKELKRLAKAAGKEVKREERTLLDEILTAPAVSRAPIEFWSSAKETIGRMCQEQPELRKTLLHLVPNFSGDRLKQGGAWLDLLDEWEASKLLETEPGGARWFSRMLGHFYHWSSVTPNPDQMFSLIRRAAPRMASENEPVVVRDLWRADLDLIELLLSLKVPIKVENSYSYAVFNLPYWAKGCGGERPKDPIHLSQNEALRPFLLSSIDRHYGSEPFDSVSTPMPGWKALKKIWLEQQVEKLEQGALPTLREILENWEQNAKGSILADYPELRQRLRGLKRSTVLARTLRGFVPDELCWPALEKAIAELGAETAQVDGMFPYAVVSNAVRVIAVGSQGEVARHELKLPSGAKLEAAAYVDGEFLLRYRDSSGWRAVWSGGKECEVGYFYGGFRALRCADIPGLGLTYGDQAVRAGDSQMDKLQASRLVCDGQTCWRTEWSQGETVLREFDPRAGNAGRRSWPGFLESWIDAESRLEVGSCELFPLPPGLSSSLLGAKDGLAGWRLRRRGEEWEGETTSGQSYRGSQITNGILTLEGAERQIRSFHNQASLIQDGVTVCDSRTTPEAILWKLEPHWWHLYQARELEDSRALRQVSDARADTVSFKNPVLRKSHQKLVQDSQELFQRLESFLGEPEKAGLPSVKGEQVKELAASFSLQVHGNHSLSDEAKAFSALLPTEATSPGLLGKLVGLISGANSGAAAPLPEPGPFPFIQACAGQLGALAWRLVAPFSDSKERQSGLDLLQWWASSPLVREPQKFRRLQVKLPNDSHFLALAQGSSRYLLAPLFHGQQSHLGFEATSDGKFRLPKGATLEWSEPCSQGWDTPDRIAAFVEAAQSRGAIPWNSEHPKRLSEITGLSYAESCLLWAGFPYFQSWQSTFLPNEVRETMGLKPAEAKVARDNLRLSSEQRLSLFSQAMPADPVRLWSDTAACVERLGESWNKLMGARLSVSPEVLKALSGLSYLKPSEFLTAFADPANSMFNKDGRSETTGWNVQIEPADSFQQSHLRLSLSYLAYFFEYLPVGDPLRQTSVKAWPFIAERLKNPNLLFYACSLDDSDPKSLEPWRSILGGNDNGKVMMETDQWGRTSFYYRPAQTEPDDPIMKALAAQRGASDWEVLRAVTTLEFANFLERFQTTPVPSGGYESNPLLSDPALVREAQDHLGLSEPEAVLYLQTLTLLEPTSKNLQLWNGWTPAAYKKAAAALTQRGLLLEAKRSRAGRSHFLPGGWLEQKAPQLPFETWKALLYGIPTQAARPNMGHILNLTPSHQLFRKAWERVLAGDAPAYEEVRKS